MPSTRHRLSSVASMNRSMLFYKVCNVVLVVVIELVGGYLKLRYMPSPPRIHPGGRAFSLVDFTSSALSLYTFVYLNLRRKDQVRVMVIGVTASAVC